MTCRALIDDRGELTAEKARRLLSYNPESGVLTWRVSSARNVFAGDVAGGIHPTGCVVVGIDGRQYKAHRLIWLIVYGCWPAKYIDHVDRDPSNNRIENLREAEAYENSWNIKTRINSTTGITGVYWSKRRKKYRVQIMVRGKRLHVGEFDSLDAAASARRCAEKRMFGRFAPMREGHV